MKGFYPIFCNDEKIKGVLTINFVKRYPWAQQEAVTLLEEKSSNGIMRESVENFRKYISFVRVFISYF